MTRHYEFDPAQRIWIRPDSETLPYSDGDESEDYVYSVIKNAKDVSANSPELVSVIKDWPSEYHLSPIRHNLLRPFEFKRTDRILELGCGCGAITRYLGEFSANIVAVEGSRRRAMIAAERCRDLPNVSVYCDNLVDFQMEGKFDIIMLIGVLEYSPLYVSASDPVGYVLETVCRHLRPGGKLMLAIENQLGLKYFSGCSEDHTNIPFFGIYDLYRSGTPVTFGKAELTKKLTDAGLNNAEFFYPFPDYKVPEVVLAEAALVREDFRPADLLYRNPVRDYGNVPWRAFYENLVWRSVARNGLLADLANSFFVVVNNSSQSSQTKWLAQVFSTSRLPVFATKTVFQEAEEGIVVAKTPLCLNPNFLNKTRFRHHPPPKANYIAGEVYAIELQRIMARAGSLDEIARWAFRWLEHLAQRADVISKQLLPGDCVDVIPANLIITSSGTLVEIDAEWSAIEPIPLTWILIRGLVNALMSSPPSPVFSQLSYREAVGLVLDRLNYPLSDHDFKIAVALEDELQKLVNGSSWKGPLYGEILSDPTLSFAGTLSFWTLLANKQREFDRVKSSVSWQVTKPLRVLWNLLRKIFPGRTNV